MGESTLPIQQEEIIKNIDVVQNQLQKTISSVIGSLETLGEMLRCDKDMAEIEYFINCLEAYIGRTKNITEETQKDWGNYYNYQHIITNNESYYEEIDENVEPSYVSGLDLQPGFDDRLMHFDPEDEIIPEKFWPIEAGPTKRKGKKNERLWKTLLIVSFTELFLIAFFVFLVFAF